MARTEIDCPNCTTGRGHAESDFDTAQAKVYFCGDCRGRTGFISFLVRPTDLVYYLPAPTPRYQHRDGLVTFG